MKYLRPIPLVLLAILILVPLQPACADAAPPMNPPGGDVSPEGGTQVQMLAEQVTIDFRQNTDDSANVSAWFQFQNTGNGDEHLKVRFPLNGDERGKADPVTGNYSTYFPLIKDFTASVGGNKLPIQVVEDKDSNAAQFFLGNSAVIYWAEFDMSFTAGTIVKLSVNYTFTPTEELSYAIVNYLMATGAGWKGPIGKADVVIRFPYVLNEYNLPDYNDINNYEYPGRATTVRENDVWIHWDDLEPTNQDNVHVTILPPHMWQAIMQQRGRVIAFPNDADAWVALARAYADAGQDKHGMFSNQYLGSLYILACERALTLDPNNVALHVEFASNMSWAAPFSKDSSYEEAIATNELATALKLDPTNAEALALYHQLQGADSSFTLPTPGPFPTYAAPTPTIELAANTEPPTPTILPTAIATLLPTGTPLVSIPSATPGPVVTGNHFPTMVMLFGGLILLAIGFGAGWFVHHGK